MQKDIRTWWSKTEKFTGRWVVDQQYGWVQRRNYTLSRHTASKFVLNFYATVTCLKMTRSMGPIYHMPLPISAACRNQHDPHDGHMYGRDQILSSISYDKAQAKPKFFFIYSAKLLSLYSKFQLHNSNMHNKSMYFDSMRSNMCVYKLINMRIDYMLLLVLVPLLNIRNFYLFNL
jgi:hypothetical protein